MVQAKITSNKKWRFHKGQYQPLYTDCVCMCVYVCLCVFKDYDGCLRHLRSIKSWLRFRIKCWKTEPLQHPVASQLTGCYCLLPWQRKTAQQVGQQPGQQVFIYRIETPLKVDLIKSLITVINQCSWSNVRMLECNHGNRYTVNNV